MLQLLLAVDIGNTNIVAALFDDTEKDSGPVNIIQEWRIFTDTRRTGDEYFSVLLTLFRDAGVQTDQISSAVLCSVVPALIGAFVTVVQRLTGSKPILVGPALYDSLPVRVPETAKYEIGTDLVCNAVEAWSRYRDSCIVVDFGTALTFTTVGKNGAVEGIAIAPGIGTALKSLFLNTAQLPEVPLEAPPSSLGMNTTQSIQSGIVLGYKGLVESLTARIKHDLALKTKCSESSIHVLATGGLNSVLRPITDCFESFDKDLTLCGLRRIALIMKKSGSR